MANRGDSQLGRPVRFVRPHALLGAATGLVAQFRCGLWGWLANVHSTGAAARRALVSLASIAEWLVNNRCVSAPHDDTRAPFALPKYY